jgi:hypothetical protein
MNMQDMVHILVKLDGRLAELVGCDRLEYALVRPATLGTVLELVALKHASLTDVLKSCRFTINGRQADPSSNLAGGDEIVVGPVT